MQSKSLPLTIDGIFMVVGLAILTALFGIVAPAEPWDQTDWKQRTTKDVHKILYGSPWVSNCCREWVGGKYADEDAAHLGYSASIVSSLVVRQALVRRMEFDKRYKRLDLAGRQEVEHRIAACLDQRFDDQIVVSFPFNLSHDPLSKAINDISSRIRLVTSDGRKILGQVVSDSIAKKCDGFSKYGNLPPTGFYAEWALYGPDHELAFPRFVEGKPTIGPNDKQIRIELDFFKNAIQGHTVGEIDFQIDKLIYQGKPDF